MMLSTSNPRLPKRAQIPIPLLLPPLTRHRRAPYSHSRRRFFRSRLRVGRNVVEERFLLVVERVRAAGCTSGPWSGRPCFARRRRLGSGFRRSTSVGEVRQHQRRLVKLGVGSIEIEWRIRYDAGSFDCRSVVSSSTSSSSATSAASSLRRRRLLLLLLLLWRRRLLLVPAAHSQLVHSSLDALNRYLRRSDRSISRNLPLRLLLTYVGNVAWLLWLLLLSIRLSRLGCGCSLDHSSCCRSGGRCWVRWSRAGCRSSSDRRLSLSSCPLRIRWGLDAA